MRITTRMTTETKQEIPPKSPTSVMEELAEINVTNHAQLGRPYDDGDTDDYTDNVIDTLTGSARNTTNNSEEVIKTKEVTENFKRIKEEQSTQWLSLQEKDSRLTQMADSITEQETDLV